VCHQVLSAGAGALNAPLVTISFTLDGEAISALPGESILQAAQRYGKEIPFLCFKEGYRADGNCRACVVEIDGERVLAPSCCRAPKLGMKVYSENQRARTSQAMVIELLLGDNAVQLHTQKSELSYWAKKLSVSQSRFAGKDLALTSAPTPAREQVAADLSHSAIAVNLDACIQCGLCVRACREEQGNDVIGYAGRGEHSKIVFDFDDPLGASSCVACGECVQACPTGALLPATVIEARKNGLGDTISKTDSLCPFCGVGCQLSYFVADNKIISVDGRDGPANKSRLCVKGRFGFDYAMSPDRLTQPLIRRDPASKNSVFGRVPDDWKKDFREASWDEALALVGEEFLRLKNTHGSKSLAGLGSAKGSNEEAYLFQKLVRTGFGNNNVDHCTRLCHASSVAALMEGVGSAAVSNQVSDVAFAELIFIIGANPSVNHPVAASWIKNAVKRGAALVIADPRRTELSRIASDVLQFTADTDVALLNAMLHTIIFEGLTDQTFLATRTTDYADLKANVAQFSPEAMAPVCGIDATVIRAVARKFAKSKASMIFWGMGVSQHTHGTDNARCLIALAMITGHIGRPGTGLHPLRGQNNVQGASDAGLIPMVLPDYQPVSSGADRFERLWQLPAGSLDRAPGLTVVEIMAAAAQRSIKGLYVMGENPAMSDPDLAHARAALAKLDFLVVQDIFPTETAYLADVILPASAFPEKTGSFTNTDRMVQLGREAIVPPGEARQDLWIINAIAKSMGVEWALKAAHSGQSQFAYDQPSVVFEEMRQSMDSIAGITWDRLQADGSVTYPCESMDDPGQPIVFVDRFPTETGKAKLVPVKYIRADEVPDEAYPLVLITGRQLEHWHTGSMTRRAANLNAVEPIATACLNAQTLQRIGAEPGQMLCISSRRGEINITARLDEGVADQTVFIAFAYAEAAANLLTNAALDPIGKIPEFKFCAVKAEALASVPEPLV
jgi:formate dehydrogenase major subunit